MTTSTTFRLPDLGEGLPDATLVQWHVKEGDTIKLDAPLVSMETAKAVVEVPSPYSGMVKKLYGAPNDIITTGSPLAAFELDPTVRQRTSGTSQTEFAADAGPATAPHTDQGSVVGTMPSHEASYVEQSAQIGRVKAVPAVRALAHKLKVDISRVHPRSADGVVTMKDVREAAANASAPIAPDTPLATGQATPSPAPSSLSPIGKPIRNTPSPESSFGQPEALSGTRRSMAHVMASAHAQVVPTTLVDDADLHAWVGKQGISVRLVQAIVTACRKVPALNAWFDGENLSRTLHPQVDIGIAVDSDEGLFVANLRNADTLDSHGIRNAIKRLRSAVEDRSISSSELSGHTISLSNFGVFCGRYATAVVVPPCVAIVAAGMLQHDVVPVMGGVEVHRRLPLSLSFDHRAVTGGEAARFLKALMDDLSLPLKETNT